MSLLQDTEINSKDDTKGVINPRIVTEVIEPADRRSKGKKINSKDDTKVINPHQFDPNPFPKFFIIIIGGIILSSTGFLAYRVIRERQVISDSQLTIVQSFKS
ncbi:MAG: hypothetical protein ACKO2Z_34130, partial [Sphaerospermopsis kisseleviana]